MTVELAEKLKIFMYIDMIKKMILNHVSEEPMAKRVDSMYENLDWNNYSFCTFTTISCPENAKKPISATIWSPAS